MITILTLGLLAAAASAAETPVLRTMEDKPSYAVGVGLAGALKRQGMEVELDLVIRGLPNGLPGEKPLLPEKKFRQLLVNVQTVARRKQAIYLLNEQPQTQEVLPLCQ